MDFVSQKNIRQGTPQLTSFEVSRTSYYGGNQQTRDDIPPEQREGFDRLLHGMKAIAVYRERGRQGNKKYQDKLSGFME